MLSYLGYGADAGVGYCAVTPPLARNIWTGARYGFVVWNAGYEGWFPLMGILPPAHRDARGRDITMLAAHTVYGVALGATAELQQSCNVHISTFRRGTAAIFAKPASGAQLAPLAGFLTKLLLRGRQSGSTFGPPIVSGSRPRFSVGAAAP